jgi:hypothetical protein
MKKLGVFSRWTIAAALLGCITAIAHGQAEIDHNVRVIDNGAAKAPFVPRYYHLAFVVKELEAGKVINSRSYDLSIGTLENTTNNSYNNRSIRTGTKVPISDDKGNVSYVDVGIKFDCKNLVVLGDRLALDVSAEISSIQNDTADNHPPIQIAGHTQNFVTSLTPVIQQNTWNSQVMVVLGKPTVLFSSDEVTSKRTMQLELTATEIK